MSMLAKQIIIVCMIIPFIEYYNYTAVRKAIHSSNPATKRWIWMLYFALTMSVLAGLFAFPLLASSAWPSHFVKIMVNLMIGVFIGKLVVSILMFLADIIIFIKRIVEYALHRFRQRSGSGNRLESDHLRLMTRSQFISQSALLCGAAFTAGLGYGMTNKYKYRLKHIPIPLTGLAATFKGLRIVQISDIHAGSFDNPEAVIHGINMILDVRPDLILFTGDLVNYRSAEFEPYAGIFSRLTAPLGIYSVLGNHDYGDYLTWNSEAERNADVEKLMNIQQSMGWQVLRNAHTVLRWKDQDFALIGVDNWSVKTRFPKYGDLKRAMSSLDKKDFPLHILMSHDPSHWDAEIRPLYPQIHLTLSGHTHGMQLGVEIPGFKWSPAQYLYKQWAGLYREDNQFLYVNRGFGFIGYDGRLGIMPEITVLELV